MSTKQSNPYDVYGEKRPGLVTSTSGEPVFNPYSFSSASTTRGAPEDEHDGHHEYGGHGDQTPYNNYEEEDSYRDEPFAPPPHDSTMPSPSPGRLSKSRPSDGVVSPPLAPAMPRVR